MFRYASYSLLMLGVVIAIPTRTQSQVHSDPCATAAGKQVYSNVFVQEETGDVLGYELAIKHPGDVGPDALLYVYEGGEAGDGIPISGQISKKRIAMAGTWVEQFTEYPSEKKIVQKQPVDVMGILNSRAFRGKLTIGGAGQHVQLRRVQNIFFCNTGPHSFN